HLGELLARLRIREVADAPRVDALVLAERAVGRVNLLDESLDRPLTSPARNAPHRNVRVELLPSLLLRPHLREVELGIVEHLPRELADLGIVRRLFDCRKSVSPRRRVLPPGIDL